VRERDQGVLPLLRHGLHDGLMDRHIAEHGGDGGDGLTELLLDEVFDDGLPG